MTLTEPTQQPYILIADRVFKNPELLDEVLLHEWCHVLEAMYSAEMRKPAPEDCTAYAPVCGKGYAELLRTLRQVNNG